MEHPTTERRRRTGDLPPREMVSFRLGEQDFCIDIMNVREIRRWTPPTPLPHAPDHVLGLVNLRGAVLPVIDLAQALGLGVASPGTARGASGRAVVIVAMLGERVFGLVVDAVSDILSVPEEAVRPVPALGEFPDAGLIQGIAAVGERMIRLLDLAGVLRGAPGDPA
jgi:purine-binding chemotaxis protein CheW